MMITGDLATVLALLGGAISLFLLGRPRADAVALIAMVLLPLTGVISVREALAGFSNPNVILIGCLFIIGEGLVRTGVAQHVGDWLLRHGGQSEARLLVLLMAVVAMMGSIMSTTAVVAIFIPIVLRVTQQAEMSSRRILMPMGMAAMISGMLTLVATTPNLLINSALVYDGYPGFSFFEFTPIGIVVLAAAIVYMLGVRRFLGDGRASRQASRPSMGDWATRYALQDRAYRLRVGPQSDLVGRSLGACGLDVNPQACVVAIERSARFARAVLQATADCVMEEGDILLLDVEAASFDIAQFGAQHGLEPLPMSGAYFLDQARDVGMAEVIVPPESRLVDAHPRSSPTLKQHGLAVVGVWRGRKALRDLHGIRIRVGDTLLVVGPWKAIFSMQAEEHDLVSLALPAETDALVPLPEKAPHALFALAVVVLLMLTDWLPNVMAGLIGCLLMGLFGCMSLDVAYRSISWRSLLLIIGMLPFAVALEHSGGVDLAADLLLHVAGPWGIHAQLAIVFLATVSLGIAISGTATAVLMGPVAISLAEMLHASPQAFAMTVAIGASAAFMSPISTPSNALVSVAGRYTFGDYLKLGTPLMVIALLATIALVPVLFPS
ncbi:SLC13 family permease [Bordetella petrii]|uniref:SLC13 family permease n=1 Tax=Bordetella petrii TaxID=94624 RepID=UPI001E63EA56|nr:SLC13 family permease [Bordetella petrii]MCD0504495.1 SLC13 family permease [Bordetella petrii]